MGKNTQSELLVSQQLFSFILILTIVIGFFLRIINVGELSLWVDEYVHVIRAKDFVAGKGSLFTNDNNGILYTIFILPFFSLFENSAFWARFPSVILGTGSIYMVYKTGRLLFNNKVGLFSAILLSFSIYNVYWSRISRNYVIFMFFYLVSLFFFWKAFENKEDKGNGNILKDYGIDLKFMALFFLAIALSVLSHQLTFLFIFGFAFYVILNQVFIFFKKDENNTRNKYFLLSAFSAIALFLIFTPFTSSFIKGILGQFLPSRIVTWVMPNWDELIVYFGATPFRTFNVYFDVLKNDMPILFWIGLVGLLSSFFVKRKAAIFLFAMFVVPFLLMSFIFKDPSLPRYIIFIYPLFLMSIGVVLYHVSELVFKRMIKKANVRNYTIVTLLFPVAFLVSFIQYDSIGSLVGAEKKHGFVVDRSLSNWSFTDWKYPARYVKSMLQEGDIVLSTVPPATDYYMDIDSSVLFRQRYYDTSEKKYKNFEVNTCDPPCAKTIDDILYILNNYERGWLLADYYFYNIMTDPRARALVCKYMDYHSQGDRDGGVVVLSWNRKSPPPVENQSMLYVLGKSDTKLSSDELAMNITPGIEKRDNLQVITYARAVSKNEMILLINNKHKIIFPSTRTQTDIEPLSVNLKPGILIPGRNTFRFFYNNGVNNDQVQGFSVHHLTINVR